MARSAAFRSQALPIAILTAAMALLLLTPLLTGKSAFADELSAGEAADSQAPHAPAQAPEAAQAKNIYRMTKPSTGEQRLVADERRRSKLLRARWRYEGTAFKAPPTSSKPVYQLSEATSAKRYYTASYREYRKLVKTGKWKGAGIAFYAADSSEVPVYQLYDPLSKSRLYVTGTRERQALVKAGCKYEKVAWHASAAGKAVDWVSTLRVAEKTNQLIIVEAQGTQATVSMHTKQGGVWKRVVTTSKGWVGRSGIGRAREGVDYTPTGILKPDRAFGIKPDPGCQMGYLKVNWSHYWCGDSYSPLYNKLVSTDDRTDFSFAASEHLASMGPVYNYCLNMGWNASCKPHGGSAFFLHCTQGRPTAGCVSVPQSVMKKILRTIQRGCRIVIQTPNGIMRY